MRRSNIKVTQIDVRYAQLNLEFAKAETSRGCVAWTRPPPACVKRLASGERSLAIPVHRCRPTAGDRQKRARPPTPWANRGESAQAALAKQVADLEISAQHWSFNPSSRRYAAGSDIMRSNIPRASQREYRPGASVPEMPPYLVGRRRTCPAGQRLGQPRASRRRQDAPPGRPGSRSLLPQMAGSRGEDQELERHPRRRAKIASTVQGRFDAVNVSG